MIKTHTFQFTVLLNDDGDTGTLNVKVTDEGVIFDLTDQPGESLVSTWARTAQEIADEVL